MQLPCSLTIAVMLAAGLCACGGDHSEKILVAVATSAAPAIEEAAAQWSAEGGAEASFTTGASGALELQIREGAPVAIFFSADRERVDSLVDAGLLERETSAVYALGELIVFQGKDPDAAITSIGELRNAMNEGARIAIANPSSAPYGRAARQVLDSLGVADEDDSIVIAENVRQAMEFARTGNVEAAFGARSLLPGDGGSWVSVDRSLYDPIEQTCAIAVENPQRDNALAFRDFVLSDAGRTILERHGFSVP